MSIQAIRKLLLWVQGYSLLDYAIGVYQYPSYEQLLEASYDIGVKFPNCARAYNALDRFPDISPSKSCGSKPCDYVAIEIGATPSKEIPQVFLSGAVHGDERPGPLAVLEIARLICEGVTGLDLDRLTVIAVPTPNAVGYYENVREDDRIDPNRDFPYDADPSSTLRSTTAQVIFSIFQHYGNIQSGITFHAGTQSITYPWGSYNHLNDLAPDDKALGTTAALMQTVSGRVLQSSWTYPIGTMNDVVYAVHGGLEDWAYALGFESSPFCLTRPLPTSVIGPICNNTLPSASIFLVETSMDKQPPESDLGSMDQIWTKSSGYIPIIPRLVRMAIKTIDVVYPSIQLVPMMFDAQLVLLASGCVEISSLNVTFIFQDSQHSGNFFLENMKCTVSDSLTQATLIIVPVPIFANNSCVGVGISGTLDALWSTNSSQLLYTKNRTVDVGTVELPSEQGICGPVETPDGFYDVCVAASHVFIHPALVRFKPKVEIDGVVVVTEGRHSIVPNEKVGFTPLFGAVVSVTAYTGTWNAKSLLSSDQPPNGVATGGSNNLLFLLFLLLLIPIGIVGVVWYRRRSKILAYIPASATTPVATA